MLLVRTKLGWDSVKGVCVLADQRIVKGVTVTGHNPSWDRVFTWQEINRMPHYQKTFVEKLMYQYEFGNDERYILPFGNEGYMNHSFEPSVDEQGVARYNIEIGEELTCDYTLLDSNCVKGSEPWLS